MNNLSLAHKSNRFKKVAKAIEVPYYDLDYGSNSAIIKRKHQMMGDWFSDLVSDVFDPVKAFQDTLNAVNQAIKGISNAISNINWQLVGNNLGLAVRSISNVMLQMNPYYYQVQAIKSNPVTAHIFTEIDNFTGGAITDFTNVETLPERVMRGDAISKTELIRDGIFVLKVIIVVVSGGSASTIVSTGSGQLAQGTAGQTAIGKDVLVVASAASLAALTDGSISTAIVKSSENIGLSAAQVEVVKKTPLAQTPLGGIAVGAGFAAGGGALTGSGATAGLTSYGQATAVSQGSLLAKGPLSQVTGAAAGAAYSQLLETSFTSSESTPTPEAPIDIPGAIADAFVRAGKNIASVPGTLEELPGRIADALSNISAPSFSAPSISAPSIATPSISFPSIGIPKIPLIRGHRVVTSRRKSRFMITYTLDDGTEVDEYDYDSLISFGILLIASLMTGYEVVKHRTESRAV